MVTSLSTIEARLPHLICPVCYHTELEAVLRCDLGWSECLPTIHCSHCGASFEPNIHIETLESLERRIARGEVNVACPTCHHRYPSIEFRCELADRSCFYVLRCRGCGAVRQLAF